MQKLIGCLLTLSFIFTLTGESFAGQAKKPIPAQPATGIGKIVALLEKSGYKYTKLKEGVWQIQFEGKNLKAFVINISSISDLTLMFVDLAANNGAALVPYLLEGVAGNPALNGPDGIHPNAAGQKILAENVWRVIEPVAREMAAH